MHSMAHSLDNIGLDFLNLNKVVFYFRVRGNSFMPCDRFPEPLTKN